MKAHLLQATRDFDFDGELPSHHQDLTQDLELDTVLGAMAAGDAFLLNVCRRVLLASLTDPPEIVYRQEVLADCIAEPEVVREMYDLAGQALADKRGMWGYHSQFPSSILSGAVRQLEALVVRLKQLREIADRHAKRFLSTGMTTLFETIEAELDDDYLHTVDEHLKRLRFRGGQLMSARLGRDNGGIDYVLRSDENAKPRWRELLDIGSRSSYSFTISSRDEAGGQALAELTNRGINLVANAAARSADHISAYFARLRAELGFYVGCLHLRDQPATSGAPTSSPVPEPAR